MILFAFLQAKYELYRESVVTKHNTERQIETKQVRSVNPNLNPYPNPYTYPYPYRNLLRTNERQHS